MSFVQLDDNIGDHPKTLDISDAAFAMWVRAIAYCSKHLTDGFVPESALRRLTRHRTPKVVAAELVRARLFDVAEGVDPASEGSAEGERGSSEGRATRERGSSTGFRVHDYLAHNMSADVVRARREAERARKQAAREKQGRDANGRVTSGRTDAGRPPGHPPDVRAESERSPTGPLLSSPLPSSSTPTVSGPPGGLEREVVAILRAELGQRFAAIVDAHQLALVLLQKSRVDAPNAPDRRDVVRAAARDVGQAKRVENVESLLHHKVDVYRVPGAIDRAMQAKAATRAANEQAPTGDDDVPDSFFDDLITKPRFGP